MLASKSYKCEHTGKITYKNGIRQKMGLHMYECIGINSLIEKKKKIE